MNHVLQLLDALNRKERFFVFTYATGNSTLALSPEFRRALSAAAGVEIPSDAHAYIDYHLDWLHAAVHTGRRTPGGPIWLNRASGSPVTLKAESSLGVSTGTQEDIDLLVTFEDGGVTWTILVEAKAESGWTNKQLQSKARRLRAIFGDGPDGSIADLRPRFCLLSPRRPQRVDFSGWPEWMLAPASSGEITQRIRWFRLPYPSGRKQLIGCNDAGFPSAERAYWTIVDAG